MRTTSIAFLTLAYAIFGAGLANGSNIVTNPGFETGDLSGWTVSGTDSAPADNGLYYGVDALDAHAGAFGGYFGPLGGVLDLSQSLNTTPGTAYTISFWLAQSPSASLPYMNSFAVSFAGTTLSSLTNVGAGAYQQYSYSGLATTTSSNLIFAFRDDTGFFSLDDISISGPSGSSTPEPATLFLAVPLASIFLVLRRNSKLCE